MAKYRRTERQFKDIGRSERSFRGEVKETDSIDEEYIQELRRKFEAPPPPPPPTKVRLIKRAPRAEHG